MDLYLALFSKYRSLTPSFYSLPLQLYLVDAFTYAASALSAAAVSWVVYIESLPYSCRIGSDAIYVGFPVLPRIRIPAFWSTDVR